MTIEDCDEALRIDPNHVNAKMWLEEKRGSKKAGNTTLY
jgi:hypothetical protein